jgi:hypothetical protein
MAVEVENPDFEAIALCSLGNAELALGRHAQAAAAFARAKQIATTLDTATRLDAATGLVRVALAQQDATLVQRLVEELLSHLDSHDALEGTEAPYLIRLTCHQALAHAGDPRAAQLLGSAHAELLAEAVSIADAALRQSFLNNIPEHRAIMAAWTRNPAPRF